MKKGLFLSLLLAVLFIGMGNVKALALFGTTTNASGTVYSSTNSTLKGGSVSIQNNGANSAAYLGIDADKTIAAGKKYQATISFVNSSFKSIRKRCREKYVFIDHSIDRSNCSERY